MAEELRFEWDSAKAAINRRNHGVSFEEARTVFNDPNVFFEEDFAHSVSEDRVKAIGFSTKDRLLAVIFTVRGDAYRLINAHKATAAEEAPYAEGLR